MVITCKNQNPKSQDESYIKSFMKINELDNSREEIDNLEQLDIYSWALSLLKILLHR